MTSAYLNRIATAVPPHDVHRAFVDFAEGLLENPRERALFRRMVERGGIRHRWSPLAPSASSGRPGDNRLAVDQDGVYTRGAFPTTGQRMRLYEREAPLLAAQAVESLNLEAEETAITHVLVVSCTGFMAPGLDHEILRRLALPATVERTVIGFMGCYAAINALKLARHIVRSEPEAGVLIVAVELCSLHLQESRDLEQILSFLVFGDGCAAALVTARPKGLRLDRFRALVLGEDAELITWTIGDSGFDMVLSGRVPATLGRALKAQEGEILAGRASGEIEHWAVHPGGRSVLDAVEGALALPAEALAHSRRVLSDFGNMSSATVLFVLERILAAPQRRRVSVGCALAFGPGLTAETMLFDRAAA